MKSAKTWLGILFLCLAVSVKAFGSEGMWGENGVVICNEMLNQKSPQIILSASGSAIIVWTDARTSNYNLYAQRINSRGIAQWTANGVVISDAGDNQRRPQLISDGADGAIIAWLDNRAGCAEVYAQRIDSSGNAQWTANGVVICAGHDNDSPQIISDGSGGAIIVWVDYLDVMPKLYAQKINNSGFVQWTANGVELRKEGFFELTYQLISGGSGGALIVTSDINMFYMQSINNSGVVQWGDAGVGISAGSNPQLMSDGSGGALIVWSDGDIYAQRIDSSGNLQWTSNGVVMCNAGGGQSYPRLISDGSGGALVVWQDYRDGNSDIYAQRIGGNGVVQWMADGVIICNAGTDQSASKIVSDQNNGALIIWEDKRSDMDGDTYVQRINSTGANLWRENGLVICDGENDQTAHQLISDGFGGALTVWQDQRAGNYDIYAQKIIRPKPQITSLSPNQSPGSEIPGNITIYGSGFWDDRGIITYVKLTRTSEPDIPFTNLNILNPDTLTGDLLITGSTARGDWFVVAYDSLGQTGTSNTVFFNVYEPSMQSLAWISASAASIYTGTRDNLVGQINCTAEGYDFLESLSVENTGSALAGTDITVLSLWYQSNGGSGGITFDPLQARKLGDFTAISGERAWHITLQEKVHDRSALYLTADVSAGAQVGNTCRFFLPIAGAEFQFKSALPAGILLSGTEQVIIKSASLQMDFISLVPVNITPSQCGVRLGRIEATNISGGTISLDSILMTLRDLAGNEQDLDAVFARIWLERAGNTVSSLAAPGEGKTFIFIASLDLFAQDQATFELKGDIRSSPSQKSFVVGLPHEQCMNNSGLLSETIPGQAFPLLTNPINIREPELTKVFSNYPNPFHSGQGVTKIAYYLKSPGWVKIEVLTMGGQGVKVVVAEEKTAGMQEAEWNGKNAQGYEVRSGIYLLWIEVRYADGTQEQLTRKVAVAR